MKVGLAAPLVEGFPRQTMLQLIGRADELGYETIWLSEAYGADAFTRLAELAARTTRIRLGTAIANVFARSPAMLAQTAASLDEISGGRVKLGLGSSGPQVVEGWHGVSFEHSLQRLRETVGVARMLWGGQRLRYQGSVFQLDGGLKLMQPPLRARIPIYLASLTPPGMSLAGEVADGWLPVFFSPSHYATVLAPHLLRGLELSGRARSDIQVCVLQPIVVTDRIEVGWDLARPQLALYLGGMGSHERNYYNRLFCAYGFESEARAVQDHFLAGRREAAVAAVTDEMVDLVTIVGPLPECRRRLDELERLGVDEVALQIDFGQRDAKAALEVLEALAPAA
ncbi:MAG: LLM class flavin-dependent oxidoreductase [Candidatus Dormibacteraceae bacterium]